MTKKNPLISDHNELVAFYANLTLDKFGSLPLTNEHIVFSITLNKRRNVWTSKFLQEKLFPPLVIWMTY